jgi:cytochrome P450
MEAALVLATILQRFQVRVVDSETLKPAPSVTLRPNRKVTARLTRRT